MKETLAEKPLLDVLRGRMPRRRPVWFMRQAGRYLQEYRSLRAQAGSFLDLCYNPKLACEVTLQPLRRYDLDAAILFADILVVPHAMGVGLKFEEGEGPILETVRDMDRVLRLGAIGETSEVKSVCETVALVERGLPPGAGLIGFCGGPWTVASYMIEGRGSNRELAKLAAFEGQAWFAALIEKLVAESVDYLSAQIVAGAEVVQIFDSWAGELAGAQRDEFVTKPLAEMTRRLRVKHPGVPVIVFARGLGVGHPGIAEATKAAAIGVESELALSWARDNVAGNCALQGNLDPVALLGSVDVAQRETLAVVKAVPKERHIFNLGHGIRQGTRPEVLNVVIDTVRAHDG